MERQIRRLTVGAAVAAVVALAGGVANAAFPEKPITIVVYVAPGGGIDVDARKLADIGYKMTGKTFVVKNVTGAGGLVAMKAILEQPADGYTLFATTKSVIYTLATKKSNIKLSDFEWTAMTQSDPEAIITNSALPVHTWQQILADAKDKCAKGEKQLWVGPAAGGYDHVMSMKTWKAAGIEQCVKYIPFKGGPDAMIELLGGRGTVYVGNPRDITGQPNFMIAALSRDSRMKAYPDTPTFKELNIKGLDNETMWRGFAIKNGIPEEARKFYADFFGKLIKNPEWMAHCEEMQVDPVFYGPEKFGKIAKEDLAEATSFAKAAGILK